MKYKSFKPESRDLNQIGAWPCGFYKREFPGKVRGKAFHVSILGNNSDHYQVSISCRPRAQHTCSRSYSILHGLCEAGLINTCSGLNSVPPLTKFMSTQDLRT